MFWQQLEDKYQPRPTLSIDNSSTLAALGSVIADVLNKNPHHCALFTQPGFIALLVHINRVYGQNFTDYSQVQAYQQALYHPYDIQAFWIMPLRTLLAEVLRDNPDYNQNKYKAFVALAKTLYTHDKPSADLIGKLQIQYSSLFNSHADILLTVADIAHKYKKNKLPLPSFQFKILPLLRKHWRTEGFRRHSYYFRDGVKLTHDNTQTHTYPAIGVIELDLLCKALNIRVDIANQPHCGSSNNNAIRLFIAQENGVSQRLIEADNPNLYATMAYMHEFKPIIDTNETLANNTARIKQALGAPIVRPHARFISKVNYAIKQKDDAELETLVANHADFIIQIMPDALFLHTAADSLNLMACHILLHPYSREQRIALVAIKNNDNQTPLEYIGLQAQTLATLYPEDKRAIHAQAARIQNLLVQYDTQKYNIHARFAHNQDNLALIRNTRMYQYTHNTATYGPMVWTGLQTLAAGGGVFKAFEATAGHFLGGDLIDNCERISGILSQWPIVGHFATPVNWLAGWVNLYRHTTRRLSIAAVGHSATLALTTETGRKLINHATGISLNNPDKRFSHYLQTMGAVCALSEYYGGDYFSHLVTPYIGKGLENPIVEYLQCDDLNTYANKATEYVNDTVTEWTGINLKKSAINCYIQARTHIGGLTGDETEQYLYLLSLNQAELKTELMRLGFGENVARFSPEMLARIAIQISIGDANAESVSAEFIAKSLVAYKLGFEPDMSQASQDALIQYYTQVFVNEQQKLHNSNERTVVSRLRDCIAVETHNIQDAGVENITQQYLDGSLAYDGFVARLMQSLHIAPSLQDPFKEMIDHTINNNQNRVHDMVYDLKIVVRVISTPTLDSVQTAHYLRNYGERYHAYHPSGNIGITIASVMGLQMLQQGSITQAEYDQYVTNTALVINHNYWSDDNLNKIGFNQYFKVFIEQNFKATQFSNDKEHNKYPFSRPLLPNQASNMGVTSWVAMRQIQALPFNLRAQEAVKLCQQFHPEWFIQEGAEAVIIAAMQNKFTESQVSETLAQIKLFFETAQFITPFMQNESANADAIALNRLCAPRFVRAAFAIHAIVSNTPDKAISLPLQYQYFEQLFQINNDDKFMAEVNTILRQYNPNITSDVATSIEAKSHDYAENKWLHVHPFMQRKMSECDPPSAWRKAWNEIKQNTVDYFLRQGIQMQAHSMGPFDVKVFYIFTKTIGSKPDNTPLFDIKPLRTPIRLHTGDATIGPEPEPVFDLPEPKLNALDVMTDEFLKQYELGTYQQNTFCEQAKDEAQAEAKTQEKGRAKAKELSSKPKASASNKIGSSIMPKAHAGSNMFGHLSRFNPYYFLRRKTNALYPSVYQRRGFFGRPTYTQPTQQPKNILPILVGLAEAAVIARRLWFFYQRAKPVIDKLRPNEAEAPESVATAPEAEAPPPPIQPMKPHQTEDDSSYEHPAHQESAPPITGRPMVGPNLQDTFMPFPASGVQLPHSTSTPIYQAGESQGIPGFPAEQHSGPLVYLFRKNNTSPTNGQNNHKYHHPPSHMTGFPDAKLAKRKSNRKRWKLPDKKILEWDSQHGELEMYTKNGKHLGAFDPDTGTKIKDTSPGRTIEP